MPVSTDPFHHSLYLFQVYGILPSTEMEEVLVPLTYRLLLSAHGDMNETDPETYFIYPPKSVTSTDSTPDGSCA